MQCLLLATICLLAAIMLQSGIDLRAPISRLANPLLPQVSLPCQLHAKQIANASPPIHRSVQIDLNLLQYKVVQAAAVARVDPRPQARALLVSLPLAGDAKVVPFGARQRRRQPDLLVGRLLVDDVGALVGDGDGHDARLFGTS